MQMQNHPDYLVLLKWIIRKSGTERLCEYTLNVLKRISVHANLPQISCYLVNKN